MKKGILWTIAAVVVIGGGIWWWVSSSRPATSPTAMDQTNNQAQMQTPPSQPTSSDNGVSATDSSNAALNTDLSNIDSQMNGFSSDNASVNQGMNDQPVQQQQF